MKAYLIAGALLLAGTAGFIATGHHACSSCTSPSSAKAATAQTKTIQSCWTLPEKAVAAQPAVFHSKSEENPIFISYEEAFRVARDENKLVMVDVYTDWCGWCKRLDKEVYTDPEVQKQMKQYFAPTRLNAEATTPHSFAGQTQPERNIATTWGISSYPTTMFITSDERIVQAIPGYLPAKDFALALRFIGSGAYKTNNFQEWKKNN